MSLARVDPGVQAMLDEARSLPECAAKDALLERAAAAAESLGDLDTAWKCRCQILSSSGSHAEPRFETLFMCLAWCLAVSDADPVRFDAGRVLWQYKWVATAAPKYASVPRSVLERLIDDMDARFVRGGWGRRAGLHKRLELHMLLGEPARAMEMAEAWRATRRDRGSDCVACEAACLVDLCAAVGRHEEAVAHARAIMAGRLSCATVPHSTFGDLLDSLVAVGRLDDARSCFERGRRLVGEMRQGAGVLIGPYIAFAAEHGDAGEAAALIRARLADVAEVRSDGDRARHFGLLARALRALAGRGVAEIEVPVVAGVTAVEENRVVALAQRCREIAMGHAVALDRRNGNDAMRRRLVG